MSESVTRVGFFIEKNGIIRPEKLTAEEEDIFAVSLFLGVQG